MSTTRRSESTDAPVDVFELARIRGAVGGSFPLASAARLAPMLANAAGDLTYRFEAAPDELGRPAATLNVEGDLELVCDGCGKALAFPVRVSASFWFVRTEAELNREPIAEEGPEPLLGGRCFSVAELVEDEVILALPISPRHAECGAGIGQEQEPAADRQRPFAGLSALKSRQ